MVVCGYVQLLNEDAVEDLLKDDLGKRYPWTRPGIEDMLGPTLIDSRKKKHHSIALHCTAGYKHAMAPQPAHGARAH